MILPDVNMLIYAGLQLLQSNEWITLDRDYARFPGLTWRVPSAQQ